MSAPEERQIVMLPRGLLLAAGALVAFTLGAAALGRAGIGATGSPSRAAEAPLASLDLVFEDRDDGGIAVREAGSGGLVHLVEPGTNGFIRGSLRGLARERHRRGIGSGAPIRLTAWRDGAVTVEDPSTGVQFDATAFGAENAAAFRRLLPAAPH